jgi:hypothetical protein
VKGDPTHTHTKLGNLIVHLTRFGNKESGLETELIKCIISEIVFIKIKIFILFLTFVSWHYPLQQIVSLFNIPSILHNFIHINLSVNVEIKLMHVPWRVEFQHLISTRPQTDNFPACYENQLFNINLNALYLIGNGL